jgi:hypothetical protein
MHLVTRGLALAFSSTWFKHGFRLSVYSYSDATVFSPGTSLVVIICKFNLFDDVVSLSFFFSSRNRAGRRWRVSQRGPKLGYLHHILTVLVHSLVLWLHLLLMVQRHATHRKGLIYICGLGWSLTTPHLGRRSGIHLLLHHLLLLHEKLHVHRRVLSLRSCRHHICIHHVCSSVSRGWLWGLSFLLWVLIAVY